MFSEVGVSVVSSVILLLSYFKDPEEMSEAECERPLYLTGILGDFHAFDRIARKWTDMSSLATGNSPSPRSHFGLASVGQSLYLFGGWSTSGLFLRLIYYILRFWSSSRCRMLPWFVCPRLSEFLGLHPFCVIQSVCDCKTWFSPDGKHWSNPNIALFRQDC